MRQFAKTVFASMLGTFLAFNAMVFLSLIFIMAGASFFGKAKDVGVGPNSVLSITLSGDLVEKLDVMDFDFAEFLFSGGASPSEGLFDIQESLNLAAEDKRIKAVFIKLEPFSAGTSKLTSLRKSLQKFQESGKPIFGYADDLGLNEAYLASVFDVLYLNKYAAPRILGLNLTPVFFKGTLDKLGIEAIPFQAGEAKGGVEPFIRKDLSPATRENLRLLARDLWEEISYSLGERLELVHSEMDERVNDLTFIKSPEKFFDLSWVSEAGSHLMAQDALTERLAETGDFEASSLRFVGYRGYLRGSMGGGLSLSTSTIAVVLGEGAIVDQASGSSTSDIVGHVWAKDLRDVCDKSTVKAVVLRINSPGGSPVASDVINEEVKRCAAKKPVFASFSDVAASGGYYMAAGSTKVFAEPTTITGSIGVYGMLLNAQSFLNDRIGLTFESVKTHSYSDMGSAVRPLSSIEREAIQSRIEFVYDRFLDVVSEGRGFENRGELKALAEGQVWTGTRAHKSGLVDELGGLQETISAAAKEVGLDSYALEFFPKSRSPLEKIMQGMGVKTLDFLGLRQAYGLLEEVERAGGSLEKIYTRLPWDLEISAP